MADIKNKNELKRRIDLFLDELDYSINEKFCKETMKMMKEFIGHASHRLDCEDSRVKSLKKKLKEYKDLEEQGLLLRLPIEAYFIKDKEVYKGWVQELVYSPCRKLLLDIRYDDNSLDSYRGYLGNDIFLTQAEAEQKLKEMEV